MLVIIGLIVLLILCVTSVVVTYKITDNGDHPVIISSVFLAALLIIAFFITSSITVVNVIKEDEYIYDKQQERESLVDTYNQYQSEYDNDIVHSEIYQNIRREINDFNSHIYSNHKWNKSIWIGWFYVNYSSIEPIQIIDGVAS